MERFRFGEQEGRNGRKVTVNGWLTVFARDGNTERFTIDIGGPYGGLRAQVVLDKATAGKLGAALLKWAGDGAGLLSDSFLREMGYVVRNLEAATEANAGQNRKSYTDNQDRESYQVQGFPKPKDTAPWLPPLKD